MNPIFRPVSGGSPRLEDDFHTYSLIVPCVGVGNVAQLACDLLVHNLGCSLVAHCDFRYLPAVVGANPYVDQSASEQSDMLTSAQVSC